MGAIIVPNYEQRRERRKVTWLLKIAVVREKNLPTMSWSKGNNCVQTAQLRTQGGPIRKSRKKLK
jgi:hypothetical protein